MAPSPSPCSAERGASREERGASSSAVRSSLCASRSSLLALGLGVLILALAPPTAQAAVSIDDVELPERTMAEKPFPVVVRLTNDGEEKVVNLFGALYTREEGAAPCGPATGGRFRTFTHLVNEDIRVPARSTIVYPDSGDWLHRYQRAHTDAAPSTQEFCVFVANDNAGSALISYEDYATVPISVRGVNAAPIASFSWSPETPRATADVAFRAEGSDAEGDPVSFAWDFGHLNASGRAIAEGASPTTFFFPAGDYVVTLTASDGLDETPIARTITVIAANAPTPAGERWNVPMPGWGALIALGLVAVASRRRENA